MKSLKQSTRNAIAYIALQYPQTTFTSPAIPAEYRVCMSGLVTKGFLASARIPDSDTRTFTLTVAGKRYARRYARDELDMLAEAAE